jgi:undecaprenyl-diphosphatase
MFEFFKQLDTHLFLYLNGFNSPFWDKLMWQISGTIIWVPVYAIILFFIYKKLRWNGFISFFILLLIILVADQGSVHLFKNVFQRLRPCHQPEISNLVHLVNGKCGGQYGFVSSHAANTFAFAMFVYHFFNNTFVSIFIFTWAFIVSYSRIYLGVHYPFDIICGALYGMLVGYAFFLFHQFVIQKYTIRKKPD